LACWVWANWLSAAIAANHPEIPDGWAIRQFIHFVDVQQLSNRCAAFRP
jgi:hypothetical protein